LWIGLWIGIFDLADATPSMSALALVSPIEDCFQFAHCPPGIGGRGIDSHLHSHKIPSAPARTMSASNSSAGPNSRPQLFTNAWSSAGFLWAAHGDCSLPARPHQSRINATFSPGRRRLEQLSRSGTTAVASLRLINIRSVLRRAAASIHDQSCTSFRHRGSLTVE
jgi:hypothetical protein